MYRILITYLVFVALVFVACKKKPSDPENLPPVVELYLENSAASIFDSNAQVSIKATIEDEQEIDSLVVVWSTTGGAFVSSTKTGAVWRAPSVPGSYNVAVKVTDTGDKVGRDSLSVSVDNRPPVITALQPRNPSVVIGNRLTFHVVAMDSDGHAINYHWQADIGTVLSASADSMRWQAPSSATSGIITVAAEDAFAAVGRDTARIVVYREAGSAWVADTGNHEIVKLSETGGVLLRKAGFFSPVKIALDPQRRLAWAVDYATQSLTLMDLDGTTKTVLTKLGGPTDVDVLQINGDAWVVESDSSRVIEIGNDGKKIIAKYKGFKHPSALGIDQRNGDIFIANTGAHEVVQLLSGAPAGYNISTDSGFHVAYSGFDAPVDIDTDLHTQEVWVVDKFLQTVFSLRASTKYTLGVSGLSTPEALAINSTSGVLWIADTGNGRVIKIDKQNTVTPVSGFLLPHDVAVDPNDGSVWVADTENDRIVKCTSNGEVLFVLSGFSSPQGITINPGQ